VERQFANLPAEGDHDFSVGWAVPPAGLSGKRAPGMQVTPKSGVGILEPFCFNLNVRVHTKMKKNIIIFLLGVVVGSGSYWTFRDGPLAAKVRENRLVQKVSEAVDERSNDKLKEEMEKQGKIVASKPAESGIITVDDGKLNDLVKAKMALDPTLADASIKSEVKSGEVTLSGSATSYDQVGRAIRLAMECGGTKTVVSTVVVKAK
jgi:hypothetical protein